MPDKCGCGKVSPDGYWPTKDLNTVDIDVQARVGNLYCDGEVTEGSTTTIMYPICLECWEKLRVFLEKDLKCCPQVTEEDF